MLAEIHDTQNQLSNQVSAEEAAGAISLLDLAEILDQHKMWVESGGESGVKADLCGVNLSHSDLTGVNLEGAFIQRANLIGADLSMANLRGASLVQADLRDANLLGTELRGANLMGANLYGAEGVWVGRLGGTNLFDAILPETIATFDSTRAISDASKVARWFYFLILAASLACIGLIGLTTDVRLVVDASVIPVARFPKIISMTSFYLGAPLPLFILYLRFQLLAAAFVGKHVWAAMVFKGWADAGKRRAVVPDGAGETAFSLDARRTVAFLGIGNDRSDGVGLLGGPRDTVFVLAAIFGPAGFSRDATSRFSSDAFGGGGDVCSDHCRARAATWRLVAAKIKKPVAAKLSRRRARR